MRLCGRGEMRRVAWRKECKDEEAGENVEAWNCASLSVVSIKFTILV